MDDFEQIQAYDSDEQEALYMEYFRVFQGILVSLEAVEVLKEIERPDTPSSSSYIKAAKELQSYFINAGAIKEVIDTLPQVSSLAFSHDQQCFYIIGKAIRNKVAHEGLWTPTYRTAYKLTNNWQPTTRSFAFTTEEVIKSINQLYAKRQYGATDKEQRKAQRDNQKLLDANSFIQLIDDKGYLDIIAFTSRHAALLFPVYIKLMEQAYRDSKMQSLSTLRSDFNLTTIDDQLSLLHAKLQ
jgi:predicted transcriptional regulator